MSKKDSRKSKKGKTLLIDGDIALFQVTSVNEFPLPIGGGGFCLYSDMGSCLRGFHDYMDGLMRQTGAADAVVAFTGQNNFRKELNPDYKANRKNTRKPLAYFEVKQELEKTYNCVTIDRLEGDDVIGIYATSGDVKNPVIVSRDKDLKTIPGSFYMEATQSWVDISPEEARYNHFFQTLCGDQTDNYPGCPGIGPKKAQTILTEQGVSWKTVSETFKKQGCSEDEALLNARMAFILTAPYYQNGNIELWEPNEQ